MLFRSIRRCVADFVPPSDLMAWLDGRKLDAVIHMGAISDTTASDGDLVIETNFRLSLRLLDWCTAAKVPFIYASSAATYGDGETGFEDDWSPDALKKLKPLNLYGWSKHLFDRRVARLLAQDAPRPAQHVGLKFFNVYGPNEYHKEGQRSVAHQLYPTAKAGKPARLFKSHNKKYKDGGQLRDFIWVGDCVSVMLWLLDHPNVNGLFNLGTGQARSFADLARALYAAVGRKPKLTYVPTPVAIRDKYQYFTEAKMDRLRAAGYSLAMTSLEDGMKQYAALLGADDPYL